MQLPSSGLGTFSISGSSGSSGSSGASGYVQQRVCPHCGSLVWVKIPRSLWQKLTHPGKSLCLCRSCRTKFWQDLDS